MKLFKKDYKPTVQAEELTDHERVILLEGRVNTLRHHLRLMARGYIVLFAATALSLILVVNTINKVDNEESHTKKVQAEGAPTGVCLREGIKAGLPILVNFANDLEKAQAKTPAAEKPVVQLFIGLTRNAEAPLESYALLQGHRYKGTKCPKPSELNKKK
jgi:hypothetical protein